MLQLPLSMGCQPHTFQEKQFLRMGKGKSAVVLVVATHPSCALGQKNLSADSQEINGRIISSAKSKSPVLSPQGQHLRGARALLCWLLQIGVGPESCGSNADLHQLKAVTV